MASKNRTGEGLLFVASDQGGNGFQVVAGFLDETFCFEGLEVAMLSVELWLITVFSCPSAACKGLLVIETTMG